MKQVFKCDYCSKMCTEEEIREHEPKCYCNYDRRSCYTCIHRKFKSGQTISDDLYECKVEVKIPEKCIIEYCNKYERREDTNSLGAFGNIFGNIFG